MPEQSEKRDADRRKSLRIVVFSTFFLPSPGGVQKHIFLFAKELARVGHQPVVVTESEASGFNDANLSFPVLRRVGLIRLIRLIGSADLIHLAGPPFIPLLLASLLGKPMVIEHHGYHAICPNGLLLYELDKTNCPGHFMRGEYGQCLRCMATNEGWLRSLWQLLLTFPRRLLCRWFASFNVTVSAHVQKRLELPRSLPIYHGLPDPMVDGQRLVSIAPAPLCFAYVGRLVSEKGLRVLIDAAGSLEKRGYAFRLKFVGDGPERGRLEQMVAEQGLSRWVTFTGFLSGAQLDQATEDAAVLVMPSIWEETAGLAAMEQMMRKRLVIASDVGGLGEIVGDAGLKFATGDADQLAACMQRVLDRPELVTEIGQKARQRALELFTEDRKTNQYLSLYRRLFPLSSVGPERLATCRLGNVALGRPDFRLMIFTHDWAPSVGGIQRVYTRLASELSDWPSTHTGPGPNVTLVTDTPAGEMDDSQFSFQVIRKPSLPQLVRQIRSADVLHVGGPALRPLAIAALLRKPLVIEHHGYQSICPNGLLLQGPDGTVCPGHFMNGNYRKCIGCNSGSLGWMRSSWNLALTFPRRWLARKATVNVAPSHHIKQRLRLPRTQVICHGIPMPPAATKASGNGYGGHTGRFAYVGRLVREKGVHLFLQASAQLLQHGYDVRIRIIGDGSERPYLERLTKDLGLDTRAEFLGMVAPERLDGLLAGTDAIVIPSTWEDVAPLVAIEQMMCGRLVIGADLGGLSEILEGVGLKFAADDPNALEARMREALETPYLAEQLRKKAQRRALQVFTEERMVAEHMHLYETLLTPHIE